MLRYAELSRREGTAISRSPDSTRETKASNVLDLVNLNPLMELTSGRPEIVIGLVDGPVVIIHPDLPGENAMTTTRREIALTSIQWNEPANIGSILLS